MKAWHHIRVLKKFSPILAFLIHSALPPQIAAAERKTILLDGTDWFLYGLDVGKGEDLGIERRAMQLPGTPVSVPNDVQLSSVIHDAYGQGPDVADVSKKEWWYVRAFQSPATGPDQEVWLKFDGVDYFADVWLNGEKLGDHEGAYTKFAFNITDNLQRARDNYLAVRVRAPWKIPGRSHYEFMKGEYDEWWDALPGPGQVVWPVGLHRSVRLEVLNHVHIDSLQVWTTSLHLGTASIRVKLRVNSQISGRGPGERVRLNLTLKPENFAGQPVTIADQDVTLSAGNPNGAELAISAKVPNAQLWYTWDLGPQNLYLAAATLSDSSGKILDQTSSIFGIRHVERDSNLLYRLNGKPLFLRGAWYPMSHLYPATADRWTYEKDLRLARHANMNHLVNYTVVEKDDFYELADRLGMLLFIELPFNQEGPIDAVNSRYARRDEFLHWSANEVAKIVQALSNHPAIAVWAPVSEVTENGAFKVSWDPRVADAAEGYDLFLKTMEKVVNENDHDALFFPSYCDFGEHHFWQGSLADTRYDSQFDAQAKFVSEYGALAFYPAEDILRVIKPSILSDVSLPEWPPFSSALSPPKLTDIHGYQYTGLRLLTSDITEHIERKIKSFDDYVTDSQLYQAFLYGYAADAYRRKLFAPINGIRSWMFKSFPLKPLSGFGVVDCFDSPLMAYYAQKRTFAPITVSYAIRHPLDSVPAGSPYIVPIWLSNITEDTFHSLTINTFLKSLNGDTLLQSTETTEIPSVRAKLAQTLNWKAPEKSGIYLLRSVVRSGDQIVAAASQYVKVAPAATSKPARILVLGTSEWAPPVADYLGALGAQVTPVVYVPTVVTKPENPFPASPEELQRNYDLIWLAGFNAYWREAPEQWTKIIVEAVKNGTTFVHSGSFGSFHGGGERAAALDLTPIAKLLPVKVEHGNDVMPQSTDVSLDKNHAAAMSTINPTGSAPAWLNGFDFADRRIDQFHVLRAREATETLLSTSGGPLLVSGAFGKGKTFAYLGFTPELPARDSDSLFSLDRQIRGNDQAKVFTAICSSILALAAGETPPYSLNQMIEARAMPIFEELKQAPVSNWPTVDLHWEGREANGVIKARVRIKNGDSFVAAFRLRADGTGIREGTLLPLWSDQFFDLLPGESTQCEIEFRIRNETALGQLILIGDSLTHKGQTTYVVAGQAN